MMFAIDEVCTRMKASIIRRKSRAVTVTAKTRFP